MSIIGLDPQANGWEDDQSEAGVIRTKITSADLVMVPFYSTGLWRETVGSGFFTFNTGGLPENLDGTASGVKLTVNAGLNNGVRVWQPFRGRAFGLRWLANSSQIGSVSVTVDGVTVPLGDPFYPDLRAEGMTTQINGEAGALLFDALDPGPHVAEITMTSDPVANRSLQLFGMLLDRRAGYQAPTQGVVVLDSSALPTAATQIPTGTSGRIQAVRKVVYLNTTAGPLTVTVEYSGAPMWKRSIAANETAEFDPGGLLGVTSQHKHYGSAAGITATVIGGR